MHIRSAEIVGTDRREYKEETVVDAIPDAAKADHPLDHNRKLNIVIGALVFGYYYGFILSRFYIQNDFQSIKQEIIRTGILGAVFGSAVGGLMNDCLGRKYTLLFANALIFISGVLLAIGDCGTDCFLATVWKTCLGLGVGMQSITSPIYILEVSASHLQENLLTHNCVLFAVGKFIFFSIDTIVAYYGHELDLNKTSDYIIAIAGFPSLVQFVLMLSLPDSPIWLYKRNRKEDAIKSLRKIYSSFEVQKELYALRLSIKNEKDGQKQKDRSGSNILSRIRTTWSNSLERRRIVVGIGLQIAEQLVSENTILYVFPRIIRMGGLIPSPHPKLDILHMKFPFMMAYGLCGIQRASIPFVTLKLRRRKNLLIKSYYMMVGLLGLSFILLISPNNIGGVSSKLDAISHYGNNTCPSYISATDESTWDCYKCLQVGCGFCAGIDNNFRRAPGGACLTLEANGTSPYCLAKQGIWFTPDYDTRQCEIKLYPPVNILLMVCLIPYTFGLESHMHSRMYKTEVRGRLVGTVAATNWIFFLIVILSYFMITKVGGCMLSVLLTSLICFSVIRLIKLSYLAVPEMKGSFQPKEDNSKLS